MTNQLSRETVVVATKNNISADLADDAVILDMSEGMYYGLNPVGVWNLIQEPRSIGELLDVLLEEFEVAEERCETDLMALLSDMMERRLVETGNGTPA